ncbi:MAG: hypothetical protein WEB52_14180 [Dehalococcoidia bacterium]
MLNKEVGLVLVGPLVVAAVDARRVDVIALSLLLGVGAFALPRLIFDAEGSSYGVGASWPGSLSDLFKDARFLTWGVWGLLFPLALLAHPRSLTRYAGLAALLLGVYLQLPFATDTARLLAPAAIVMVPLAMLGLQRVGLRGGARLAVVAAVVVALQLVIFQEQREDLHRLIDALQASSGAVSRGEV